jgi:group II intron reverse transcriptase/maturase
MQEAGTVLAVLRERGRKGLPCDELYRQMFSKDLYLMAYGNIYPNHGAMTPGADGRTADGMSEAEIDRIIGMMRQEKYRFSPARRVYIPKKNGKLRPLGLPTWADKLVGEVTRLLLDAYYDPQFSAHSHGFRKGHGCHTALSGVQRVWTGTTWFIEGDISDCFGSLDHQVMLSILAEKIHDNRFLRLIRNMLKAGYLEQWEYHPTLSGTPQGGVISPVLSNIYLNKLDEFVERDLIPQHTRGNGRKGNREYGRVRVRRNRAMQRGDRAAARELLRQIRALPSLDPVDPGYRRLRYTRYADDHLLGLTGTKAEAEEIREKLATFLRETLKLEMNREKTLITHARDQQARFLGYQITVQHSGTKITRDNRHPHGRRSVNGRVALLVPPDVVNAKCAPYLKHGKPWKRPGLLKLDDYGIINLYGAEYRGIVNYYLLAHNVASLGKLQRTAELSMLGTIADKHRITVSQAARRHKAKAETAYGLRSCYEAKRHREGREPIVARFGGIPLRRDKNAMIKEPVPVPEWMPRKELVHRLRRHWCELCEKGATVAVHQVARLADLGQPGSGQPLWAALMAQKRRKTLVVCASCHEHIHATPVTHAA